MSKVYTSTAPSSRELREALSTRDGRAKVRGLLLDRRAGESGERSVQVTVGRTRYTITADVGSGASPAKK